MLDSLPILDYTHELAALPRRPGCQHLPPRTQHRSITFHYSGVVYANRSRDAELQRILREATYQLNHNYAAPGRPPAYPDVLLYEYIVLSDGQIVWSGQTRQFWHCNNRLGNMTSIPVHVMLGTGQELTPPQRSSLFALWDALRVEHGIPRAAVFGHCEWPLTVGLPVTNPVYTVQRGQSICPARRLFAHIAAYRAVPDAGGGTPMRAAVLCWVRAAPSRSAPKLGEVRRGDVVRVRQLVTGDSVTLPPWGTSDAWAELVSGGYVWRGPLTEAA